MIKSLFPPSDHLRADQPRFAGGVPLRHAGERVHDGRRRARGHVAGQVPLRHLSAQAQRAPQDHLRESGKERDGRRGGGGLELLIYLVEKDI